MAQLRGVGVWSVSKIMGAMYFCVGILAGLFIAAISALGGFAAMGAGGGSQGALPAVFGMGFAIMAPFLYGAIGLIGGALMAVLYNVLAHFVGGVEMDIG